MSSVPTDLRGISPFLQRSNELANKEPVVAYYCKFYAAKMGIEIGSKNKESQIFLLRLMEDLEKEKGQLGNDEALTNDVVGMAHVESFALKIFMGADNEERAGRSSKKTAKTFLAASLFLEVLKVFGDVDSEIEEKIKYAKYKAAEIMKGIKEGRIPEVYVPGIASPVTPSGGALGEMAGEIPGNSAFIPGFEQMGLGGQQVVSATSPAPEEDPWAEMDRKIAAGAGSSTIQPSAPAFSAFTPSHAPATTPAPTAIAPMTSSASGYGDGLSSEFEGISVEMRQQLAQAQKHARYAISALQYEDIDTAIKQFRDGLIVLEAAKQHQQKSQYGAGGGQSWN
ncbi:Vta1 like-domain-containing protein [Cladochytrium replicatum]|nr:Vta1 like-domain-containing protein [Cladochytrium replicatum]